MVRLTLLISTVSAEFSAYRQAIHDVLDGSPRISIKIQEGFVAAGTPATLDKLDEYIRAADIVVHLVGSQTGSPINPESLAWVQQTYPDLAMQFPVLRPVVDGQIAASYTQWEAYLARYHGKTLIIAEPNAGAPRSGTADEQSAEQQRQHLARLAQMRGYREILFDNPDQLAAKLLVSRPFISALGEAIHQNLPYETIGFLFKGREEFIATLRGKLQSSGSARAALHGLGGIGKTRLAVEYAWRNLAHYSALLFVRVESDDDKKRSASDGAPVTESADSAVSQISLTDQLHAALASLCAPDVLNLPQYAAQDISIRLGAVLEWLKKNPGWLLILDNIETQPMAAVVEKVLPRLHDGHVLLTTRVSVWSRQVAALEVRTLPLPDAQTFLLERTEDHRQPADTDEADALALATDLGGLALALEQAGAYIDVSRVSLREYHRRWAINHEAVRGWYDEQSMQYSSSVAATWLTSFNELGPDAHTLLNRLAWLAPDPIPLSLLAVEVPDAAPIRTEAARIDLAWYSLVTYSADNLAISVHRLVQEVTRDRQKFEEQPRIFGEALRWVSQSFTGRAQDVDSWSVLIPLQPHATALTTHAVRFDDPPPVNRLLNQLGIFFKTAARFSEAEPLFRRALVINEASYGLNHPEVAVILNNLAGLLRVTNRLAEAEPLYWRALTIDETSYGPNHPDVATDLNNLAILLRVTNRLAEAEPLFRRALAIGEASYGPDHPYVATSLDNLAGLLHDTGRLDEAEPLFRRALAIDETSYAPKHPQISTRLNNLAGLLRDTGRLAEAEPLFRRALAISEASYGPSHPEVAIRLNNLALILQDTGRLAEAELLFRRALAISEASYGPSHPEVATCLNNLALLLQDTGRRVDAESLFRRALAIGEASYGPSHPDVAIRLNNLALILQDTGRLAEAEPLLRRVVGILVDFYKRSTHTHPNFQTTTITYVGLLLELQYTATEILRILTDLGIELREAEGQYTYHIT